MKQLPVIFKRQLVSYACTPSTYVSVAVFLFLCTALGLHTHQWMAGDTGNVHIFFELHPWLYLLLVPALSTQLWADEKNTSVRDLMKTLPISPADRVIGKFLAAWAVCAFALICLLPIVFIANALSTADNTVIASQYLGSWLLAGSYLSVGCFICVLTHQRVVIFVLTLALLLAISGLSSVLYALDHQAPIWLVDSLISLNPLYRFGTVDNGKLTLRDSLYFISVILAFLSATIVTLNHKLS